VVVSAAAFVGGSIMRIFGIYGNPFLFKIEVVVKGRVVALYYSTLYY
jgi:hypothetical protein